MIRRVLGATLCIVLALGATAIPAQAHRSLADRYTDCRFQSLDNGRWTVHEVRLLIDCGLRRWPDVSRSLAYQIASDESGFAWFARNPTSGACGVYQDYPASGFAGRAALFRRQVPALKIGPGCYNARSNVLVAIHMMHATGYGDWGH